jgi:hypothetical protein
MAIATVCGIPLSQRVHLMLEGLPRSSHARCANFKQPVRTTPDPFLTPR